MAVHRITQAPVRSTNDVAVDIEIRPVRAQHGERDCRRENDQARHEIKAFDQAGRADQHAAGDRDQWRDQQDGEEHVGHAQPTNRLRSRLDVLPTWATR